MKLGVITDGIDRDLEHALMVMNDTGLDYAELQFVWDKEIGDQTPEEIQKIKELINNYNVKIPCITRHNFVGMLVMATEPEDEAYKKREAERLARLRALEAEQRLKGELREFEADRIYFDFDRSELKPESKAILTKKADWLQSHPQFSVRIEGNCDERGTNEYNLALGERRANAAWKYLNALGVSGSRLSTISYGEERPLDSRSNEKAWAENRNDGFKLIE